MSDNGNNPMRWDCREQGCFNHKKRPRIEQFHDCFPRRISFGDVDAAVEINGRLLLQEWKEFYDDNPQIPTGQRIMYERITRGNLITVLCIIGNPKTMDVRKYGMFWGGHFKGWRVTNFETLKNLIKSWSNWAEQNAANWPESI